MKPCVTCGNEQPCRCAVKPLIGIEHKRATLQWASLIGKGGWVTARNFRRTLPLCRVRRLLVHSATTPLDAWVELMWRGENSASMILGPLLPAALFTLAQQEKETSLVNAILQPGELDARITCDNERATIVVAVQIETFGES